MHNLLGSEKTQDDQVTSIIILTVEVIFPLLR